EYHSQDTDPPSHIHTHTQTDRQTETERAMPPSTYCTFITAGSNVSVWLVGNKMARAAKLALVRDPQKRRLGFPGSSSGAIPKELPWG
ncbi:mCG144708, partial [Mus musculus]